MTLRDVPFPVKLLKVVPSQQQVLAHRADRLSGPKWRSVIAKAGLPAPTGAMATEETFTLDREQILGFASNDITADNAYQLLYQSLAWGLGWKGFRMESKLRGIGQTHPDTTARLLVQAWQAVREGASSSECYEVLLTPKGRPRIKYLGAAFATKYLYFATGSGTPATPILDAVVANSLRPIAWEAAPTTAWWSSTSGRYCSLLSRWASEATAATGQAVRLDQLEMMLFSLDPSRTD